MDKSNSLVTFTDRGIFCPRAGVYIDPWKPVDRAIVTHAHSDHAKPGHKHYLTHKDSTAIMRFRLGEEISIEGIDYGHTREINGVSFTLYPAGHIIGSAQVLIDYKGERWVVSGDYKIQQDGLSTPFEAVPCDHFITESTFGLPIYKWPDQREVFEEINQWWRSNAAKGKCSVLVCYALGKAQRLLKGIDSEIGPIYAHGAIYRVHELFLQQGFALPEIAYADTALEKAAFKDSLVIAAPSAIATSWMQRFEPYSLAFASGWMRIRGTRRRRAADRGFVLSDHADWDGLNKAIDASGAENVYVTHGYSDHFSRWLESRGKKAHILETAFSGELGEIGEDPEQQTNQKEEEA